MTLLWPWYALLLLLVPLLIALYVWSLRRRRKFSVGYSSLSLLRDALPKRMGWRRHVPFVLFLLAVASLSVAVARPAALIEVPLNRTTIILALDVSRSMCATDVDPNRLAVAQEAIEAFIEEQAPGTQIGLVAFAGFAEMIVPPTTDKARLQQAVDNLTTAFGTAIGSAVLKSIDALAEINSQVAPSGVELEGVARAEGDYLPDIIVLLTDGANSQGPLPLQAAGRAAERGVRVYTIGFGTTNPTSIVCSLEQDGGDAFRGGFGRGNFSGVPSGSFRRYLVIDEPTLQGVAEMTGGTYYRAEDAEQLLDVFLDLPSQIVLQKEAREISVLFVMLAAVLMLAAVGLAQLWSPPT